MTEYITKEELLSAVADYAELDRQNERLEKRVKELERQLKSAERKAKTAYDKGWKESEKRFASANSLIEELGSIFDLYKEDW